MLANPTLGFFRMGHPAIQACGSGSGLPQTLTLQMRSRFGLTVGLAAGKNPVL